MDEIERLEFRIDELRDAIERSRRWRFAGRARPCSARRCWPASCSASSITRRNVLSRRFALAIGGMVLMGSSRSSTEELERALKQAEAERIAAIDGLDLVQVGEKE